MNTIASLFSYSFIVRAIIVGGLVSLCAALLGVNLVLKRYSMIGDGLSHVGFGALSVALATGAAPLAVSAPIVILAAFALLQITEKSKIKADAAIALISTSALAIGVSVVSLTGGMNTDVDSLMFGSVLAMDSADVYISAALAATVLVIFVIFYNKLFVLTFDESFSKAVGIKTSRYNMLIAFLTAVTIVIGMRIMGTLLISSLIIFPALSSMRLFGSFKPVVISSAALSLVCFIAGIVLSFICETPAGASVVIVNIIAFFVFWIAGKIKALR